MKTGILKTAAIMTLAGGMLIGQTACSSFTNTGKGALIGGGGGAALGAGIGLSPRFNLYILQLANSSIATMVIPKAFLFYIISTNFYRKSQLNCKNLNILSIYQLYFSVFTERLNKEDNASFKSAFSNKTLYTASVIGISTFKAFAFL